MEDCLGVVGRFGHGVFIAHITDDGGNSVRMPIPKPLEIALDTWAGKPVEDENVMALVGKAVGKIGANETCAARHKNGTTIKDCGCT
jgi:hypothetical protein